MPLREGRPPQPSFDDLIERTESEPVSEPRDSFTFEELARIGLEEAARVVPGTVFTDEDIARVASNVEQNIRSVFPPEITEEEKKEK